MAVWPVGAAVLPLAGIRSKPHHNLSQVRVVRVVRVGCVGRVGHVG